VSTERRLQRLEQVAEALPATEVDGVAAFVEALPEEAVAAVLLSMQPDCWEQHERADLWPACAPPRPELRPLTEEEAGALLEGDAAILEFCREQYRKWCQWWEEAIPGEALSGSGGWTYTRAELTRECVEAEWSRA